MCRCAAKTGRGLAGTARVDGTHSFSRLIRSPLLLSPKKFHLTLFVFSLFYQLDELFKV
jgi:hypothetical protein